MDSGVVSSSSVSSGVGCKRKRTAGRQKIAIEPIQNESSRQVCFSKRRNGLFKKAEELTELCGAHIKLVVFSPAGRPYSFIHSSESQNCHVSLPDRASEQDQRIQLSDLESSFNAAKKRNVVLKGLCDADVAPADVSQHKLDVFMSDLAKRKDELSIMPYVVPVQEPVPVPVQEGNGNNCFYWEAIDADLAIGKDELSIMSYLIPVQEPVPVQDGYGNDGFYCGTSHADELFSLDDFNFGGQFGVLC